MDRPQAVVSIAVFIICVFIGLPVWWNTTKVYRAHLPQQRITSAHSTPVTLKIEVEVLTDEKITSDPQMLIDILNSKNYISLGNRRLEFLFTTSKISIEDTHTETICKKLELTHKGKNSLSYRFFILESSSTDNSCYYCSNTLNTVIMTDGFNGTKIGSEIMSLLQVYLNTKELSSNSPSDSSLKSTNYSLSMPPAVGYSIVFTLAVANPSDELLPWDIQDAVDQYFRPLLSRLDFLGEIKVSSQVIYFLDFKEKPSRDGEKFYYTKAKLPLLMNEIQPRLTTYTSTDATLNFIVYVPPSKYVPLYIRSQKKNLSSYDAFFSARWGGLQFFNPNLTSYKMKIEVPIDMLMKKFVFQLGKLFDWGHFKYSNIFPNNKIKEMAEWSRTRLLITKMFEYLNKCLNTLLSLYKLLGEIENIVISEEIRYLIESSLDNYEQSVELISKGFINDAVSHARIAFEFSEKAFYDASLLALLYFPDDQKYAIYVPLFVPIAFPILGSVYRTFLWLRNRD